MTKVPDFTGVHLWDRLRWAHANLERVESDLCIVWDPPLGDGEPQPARVTRPAPEWMACALAGGILPPVEMYLEEPRDADGNFIGPADYWSNFEGVPPMTEEEAIEYLVKKDLPREIWQDKTANRPRFIICNVNQLPATREFRNAWRIAA